MKIRLANNEDVGKVEALLSLAVSRYTQRSSAILSDEQSKVLTSHLAQMTGSVVDKLKHNIVVDAEARPSDENSDPQLEVGGPVLEDAESLALLSELRTLSQRAAEHRAEVPAMIKEKVLGQLEAMRPAQDASDPATSAAAPSVIIEPLPEELRQQLDEATGGMPKLRARLEEALGRLQRVLEAVEAEHSRPMPSTVEKAVEGEADFDADGGASPAVKQAVLSGKINTRRRLARDLRPVPYAMG